MSALNIPPTVLPSFPQPGTARFSPPSAHRNATSRRDRPISRELLRASYAELHRVGTPILTSRAPGRSIDPRTIVLEAARRSLGTSGVQELEVRGDYFAFLANALWRLTADLAMQPPGARGLVVSGPGVPEGMTLLRFLAAIDRLERRSARHAQLAVLRVFGGLSIAETAEQLGMSAQRTETSWRRLCDWLATTVAA